MDNRLFTVTVLILLILSTGCSKKPADHTDSAILINNPRWTTAPNGLRLRAEPDIKAKRLYLIPYQSRVNLLKENAQEITINEKKGLWSYIDWKGRKGWVFGAFLTKEVPRPQKGKNEKLKINNKVK